MSKTVSKTKRVMLERIRIALKDIPSSERAQDVLIDRLYRSSTEHANLLELAAERISEYRARVEIITELELPMKIRESLERNQIRKLVVPHDLPEAWKPTHLELIAEQAMQLEHHELEVIDGVLTACALAIAETGTIVLDHARGQGRRALTLIPDFHLCVVLESQIVDNLPAAMRALEPGVLAGRPLTFISGPSATSDIELSRVEGVHGPRTLEVLVVRFG